MRKKRVVCTIILASILLSTLAYADDIVTDDGFIVDSDTGEFIGTVGYNPNEGIMSAKIFGDDDREAIAFEDITYPYSTAAYIQANFKLDQNSLYKYNIEYNEHIIPGNDFKNFSGCLIARDRLLTCAHGFELPVYFHSEGNKLKYKIRVCDRDDNFKLEAERILENQNIFPSNPSYEEKLQELIEYITPGKKDIAGELLNMDLIESIQILFRYDELYLENLDLQSGKNYLSDYFIQIDNPKYMPGKWVYETESNELLNGDVFIHKSYYEQHCEGGLRKRIADSNANYYYSITKNDIACIKLPIKIGDTLGWLGTNYKLLPKRKEIKEVELVGYPVTATDTGVADYFKYTQMRKGAGQITLADESGSSYGILKSDSIDTTSGNSGGPAILKDTDDRYYVLGICSGSFPKPAEDKVYNLLSSIDLEKVNLFRLNRLVGEQYEE